MRRSTTITSPYVPDLDEVRAWLEKMVAAMNLVQLVVAIMALITRMRDINTELTKQLAHLRRKRPRSETLARLERQLQLPFADIVADEAKEKPPPKPKRSRRGRHPGRAGFPAHLERVPEVNAVPPDQRICPICGSEMTTVGYCVCEILEVIPARVVVIQRMDERVACPHDDAIVSAATPPQLVERGKLGTGLIVEAMADKYIEHLPIERQTLRWARAGVEIAPQTLGRSVATGIDLFFPIAQQIHDRTRGPGLLATDASCIPVLDHDAPDGIRNGTMWCWTNAQWVSFFYSASGDSNSVRRFLGEDLCRTVQCDGTSITTFLERAGGKRPGCWSHARRRLVQAARSGDTLALEALRKIRRLFAIEKLATRAGDTPDQRLARRDEYSRPVLDDIQAWVQGQRAVITPKSLLGQALGYLHRQWRRLILFLEDGHIELTNNRVEGELRKLVLGKKNWLFTWEDLGGERTAVILTVVATCVAHGINPRAYLHRVARLLIDGWPQSRINELLPDQIANLYPELSVRPTQLPPNVAAAPALAAAD